MQAERTVPSGLENQNRGVQAGKGKQALRPKFAAVCESRDAGGGGSELDAHACCLML
jgi:hypothetical protein